MEKLLFVRKDAQLPHERDDLRQHRGDGRSADAPAETENEQRVEDRIEDHGVDRGVHRLAGMSRGAQHGVQTQIHVRDDVAQQNDGHVFAGIADRGLAGPEEIEDRIEEQKRREAECYADDQIEHQHIAQHPLGRFVVALAQAHRNQRRGAHAHQRTERRGEVHQREGQRKARDGQRPDPVADEDAVDHVVERRGRHGDDRRHGILHEQLPDSLGSKLQSRRFYLRHKLYFLKNSITGPHVRRARPGLPHSTLCASSSRLNRAG